jgi:hypothetical protein
MLGEAVSVERRPSLDEFFVQTLSNVEDLCTGLEIDHRFVGGTISDLYRPDTQIEIDPEKRTITLDPFNPPTMLRPDGTVRDADLVCFSQDQSEIREAVSGFREIAKEAKRLGLPCPYTSIESAKWVASEREEGTIFLRDWKKRLRQWVTAFEVHQDSNSGCHLSLAIDPVRQEIPVRSVEPWHIKAGNLTLTAFNPYTHWMCYRIRAPSGVKKKDLELLPVYGGLSRITFLKKFAQRFIDQLREQTGVNIREDYEPWWQYEQALAEASGGLLPLRRQLERLYWDTIGTSASRGRGFWGPISRLSNKFTGH